MSCETLNVRVQNQASLGGPRRGGLGAEEVPRAAQNSPIHHLWSILAC